MKLAAVLHFSWRLLYSHRGRVLLIFGGIMGGSFFLALFLSFSSGLRQNILEPITTQLSSEILTITPVPPPIHGIFDPRRYLADSRTQQITPEIVQAVRALPEVQNVQTELHIPFPVATRAQLLGGIDFALDSLLSGYSAETAQPFLAVGQTFRGDETILPVLISPLLIEIYNSTLADLIPGAGKKTGTDFLGKNLEFTFGQTNYLTMLTPFPTGVAPEQKKARIVGFAPFLSPFTLGIPLSFAEHVRTQYEQIPATQLFPSALLVTLHTPQSISTLPEKLVPLGLQLKPATLNFDSLRGLFQGFEIFLVSAASAIFGIALLFLVSTVFSLVQEQRQNIGILRALGASPVTVQHIFLVQGIGLVFCASITGFLMAVSTAFFLNRFFLLHFPIHAFSISAVFLFMPLFFLKILLILLAISTILLLFPARSAAHVDPLQTLHLQ